MTLWNTVDPKFLNYKGLIINLKNKKAQKITYLENDNNINKDLLDREIHKKNYLS